MKLSIIIPVFNEGKTIREILRRVNSVRVLGIKKEIIIINDGSTDNSHKIIQKEVQIIKNAVYLIHKKNQGKGAAIKTAIKKASGDYIVIQDADLEYNPRDFAKLLLPIMQKKAKVVYGTRLNRLPNFSKDERTVRFFLHYVGNRTLSLLTSILYGHWMTDMETCYKVFPKKALENTGLNAKGFEFEPEITAKLLKKGLKIVEIPISTNPRGYNEGKKINTIKDGIKAFFTLIKYRFRD